MPIIVWPSPTLHTHRGLEVPFVPQWFPHPCPVWITVVVMVMMQQPWVSAAPFIRAALSVGLTSPLFDHLKVWNLGQARCLPGSMEQDQHLQRAARPMLGEMPQIGGLNHWRCPGGSTGCAKMRSTNWTPFVSFFFVFFFPQAESMNWEFHPFFFVLAESQKSLESWKRRPRKVFAISNR